MTTYPVFLSFLLAAIRIECIRTHTAAYRTHTIQTGYAISRHLPLQSCRMNIIHMYVLYVTTVTINRGSVNCTKCIIHNITCFIQVLIQVYPYTSPLTVLPEVLATPTELFLQTSLYAPVNQCQRFLLKFWLKLITTQQGYNSRPTDSVSAGGQSRTKTTTQYKGLVAALETT